MEEKVFKTLDELVDILKQRGIDIPDSSAGPGSFIFYGGFMEEKVFKTLDELVDILKQRGIDIP
ncbi:hypothetical protein DWY47_16170, partial [Ruminococcus sp. AF25-23LB]